MSIDLFNTKTAFAHLSDRQLKKTEWLFSMMNKPWLVKHGSNLALWAIENGIPPAGYIVKNTIFPQFVGGSTLLDSQPTIEMLGKYNTLTILDYGAEAKENELDFNHTMNENIRAIDFSSRSVTTVPVVSSKITGLARFGLLERIQSAQTLSKDELIEYRNVLKRVDAICYHAASKNMSVFFDAEESWIQDAIDHLVWLMMRRYNKKRVVVYNTFQLYRKDRLQFLMDSYDRAQKAGFLLGAKLVRGAYMEKEGERAAAMGYENPVNSSKHVTDDMYNTALRFCLDHLDTMAVCNANIPANHPHTLFSQLYGMSDNITFNLANAGYRVAKYVPYGQVRDVIPYLIRRAQENTSVTGDAGRELKLIRDEVKRRGL
ncbi:MAG: proline dehydrogenase family protein [Saprospiraceae bacterium]|nr:proline dehydrogenase family protein [Saprospiraceae bacterium]